MLNESQCCHPVRLPLCRGGHFTFVSELLVAVAVVDIVTVKTVGFILGSLAL